MVAPRNREHLTAERVRRLLDYDPSTGIFRWLELPPATKIVKVGDVAGGNDNGYVRIRVDGRTHYAHCLAWLWMTGQWPTDQVDHRNTVRSDNRWENLRQASQQLNSQNRRVAPKRTSSGFLGVSRRNRKRHPFVARICLDRKLISLGVFETAEAAHSAYVEAKRRLHQGGTL